jgi:hypothetical protein
MLLEPFKVLMCSGEGPLALQVRMRPAADAANGTDKMLSIEIGSTLGKMVSFFLRSWTEFALGSEEVWGERDSVLGCTDQAEGPCEGKCKKMIVFSSRIEPKYQQSTTPLQQHHINML